LEISLKKNIPKESAPLKIKHLLKYFILKRRKFIANSVAASIIPLSLSSQTNGKKNWKGNIKHSVCSWCIGETSLKKALKQLKAAGVIAMDLLGPKDWPLLKKLGMHSSMCNGAEINLVDGWNELSNHETLIKNYTEMIPLVAKAGYQNLICFSGNTRNLSSEEGLENCVNGLQKILTLAEKNDVIIQMELFNSKIDHPDYMCDNTAWGIELCNRLNSPNFKLLYDIYHMQINEGDIIRTIKDHHPYFGHYHTAGVPGRNEIDESQELYYPAIMQAIADTGFTGYVAQEFIAKTDDKVAALVEGCRICDV